MTVVKVLLSSSLELGAPPSVESASVRMGWGEEMVGLVDGP